MERWLWTRPNLNQANKPLLRPRQARVNLLHISLYLLHFPSHALFYIPFQPSTHFVDTFKKQCENECNILEWTYSVRKENGPNNPICTHSIPNINVNPLNAELNPICYLLVLLGAHHFLHVSRIRVKSLTLRLLMSYIYIWSTYSWCF